MKALLNPIQINKELKRLLRECVSCQVAVAWATTGFEAFAVLLKNRHKIKRMVVGTHFYQTDPSFIGQFMGEAAVKFRLSRDGVFHPKIYFFETAWGAWECIIGSPNFTNGGLSRNDELALLVTHHDIGANETRVELEAAIEHYWQQSKYLNADELENYREAYRRNQLLLKNLGGKYGPPNKDGDDGGKPPQDTDLLQMRWPEYFNRIRSESRPRYGHSIQGRCATLGAVRKLFHGHQLFSSMQPSERQRVAGLVRMVDGIDYWWFGRMSRVKNFKNAVENRCDDLSHALDVIPLAGDVSREAYMEYVERFDHAFPNGGCKIGTRTRLLAMKRPDMFLCLDGANKPKLCKKFDISRNIDHEQYWDSIIWRVRREALWWNAPPPEDALEREVWDGRMAFLDAIYYDDKEAAAS